MSTAQSRKSLFEREGCDIPCTLTTLGLGLGTLVLLPDPYYGDLAPHLYGTSA